MARIVSILSRMDPNGTLIVSDAHLGAAPAQHERAFHRFLASVPERTRDLIINGDLFDFWFEYGTVIPRRHFPTLRLLRQLVESGVRIRLVPGNHDFWGGSFLTDEIGIEIVDGPFQTSLGGRPALVAHGDGLGSGDFGYKALKSVIRSRPARGAFRWLHPDLSASIIRLISRTESRHGGIPDAESRDRAARLHEWSAAQFRERAGVEIAALAHCHVPEIREIAPGRFYVNSGDWVQHCSWAECEPERLRVLRLTDLEGESDPAVLCEVSLPQGPTGTLY